jgi:3-dehydroquinate synthase
MNNRDLPQQPGIKTRVELAERGYDILIDSGSLDLFGQALIKVCPRKRLFVVTNSIVGELYAETVVSSVRAAGLDVSLILIPDGESFKNLDTVNLIYTELLKGQADRNTALVALGGGVTGDIAGFAAATFMRGIPYIQVPTTLLAQVDSSVGGKTGVNHRMGKNMIGAFCQPRLVFVDIRTLSTQKERDFQTGMYEVIKYGLIRDEFFFSHLVSNMSSIKRLDDFLLRDTVRRCCEIKAEIVAVDEKESGLRRILNFGHTLGHALESATSYKEIPHGQAVGYGMIAAAYLSRYLDLVDDLTLNRIISGILSIGTLPSVRHVPVEKVIEACRMDKKKDGEKILFVLLDQVGHTEIRAIDQEDDMLLKAWNAALQAVENQVER